jgi:hypothetical protein
MFAMQNNARFLAERFAADRNLYQSTNVLIGAEAQAAAVDARD